MPALSSFRQRASVSRGCLKRMVVSQKLESKLLLGLQCTIGLDALEQLESLDDLEAQDEEAKASL